MAGLVGTSGNQDALRRAAQSYIGGPEGGVAPGGPVPAPAPGGNQAGVDGLLARAIQMTAAQPDLIKQNLAAWKQSLLMLGQVLQEARGGQASPGATAPAPSPGLAMGGAHGAMPMPGRPPV